MQLRLTFGRAPRPAPPVLVVSGQVVPVEFVRHVRARHYILRVREDGGLRVTIPRAGTRAGADQFLHERRGWIEREREKHAREMASRGPWRDGSKVLYRGVESDLRVEPGGSRLTVSFGEHAFTARASASDDLRPVVERYLRTVASKELPERLAGLAKEHGFNVAAVSVRNQSSRWGSCSPRGHISLNWRLIQVPPHVGDYVMLHELVHLRHLNHSVRFWRELDRLCPWHKDARAWLRSSRRLSAF